MFEKNIEIQKYDSTKTNKGTKDFGIVNIQVQSTAHQTMYFGLCTAPYFKGISANIE
jgi:hypothetical protein